MTYLASAQKARFVKSSNRFLQFSRLSRFDRFEDDAVTHLGMKQYFLL